MDLSEQAYQLGQSATWRGKHSQSQTWSGRLKKVKWMQHLSGRMLRLSRELEQNFVGKWISSLPDTPARASLMRGNGEVKMMNATFGHTSAVQSELFNLEDSSSKMSRGIYRLDSTPFYQTWLQMVTIARGEYSVRQKLGQHTRESAYLYWRTITAQEPGHKVTSDPWHRVYDGKGMHKSIGLTQQVNWMTPEAENQTGYQKAGERIYPRLGTQVQKQWGTPNTLDHMGSRSPEAMKKQAVNGERKNRTGPMNLREQIDPQMHEAYQEARAEANNSSNGSQLGLFQSLDQHSLNTPGKNQGQFPTPKTRDWKKTNPSDEARDSPNLYAYVPMKERGERDAWGTPTVFDWREDTRAPHELSHAAKQGGTANLREQVAQWSTPVTRDYKDSPGQSEKNHRALPRDVFASEGGEKHLNPEWVAQLMGMPPGWIPLGSRVDKLRMLGNAVVPHQAQNAYYHLLLNLL